jgi:hypothetical protein
MFRTPELSQKELKDFMEEGKIIILHYRCMSEIVWSHGTSQLIVRPIKKNLPNKLPYTKRGRYLAVTPDRAHSLDRM